ncbi:hypothetical protein RUMCAL_01541 [Ruminococcus callidus ATCC 27760]|uniref:Uncharacterized protein n=1 Tax=Ruminococcus callidus ATCC 27760 TaxID=411473 RepID=U2KUY8_9FIRM|nr:hypothetical protein RUMCAL_01541 [Ruminococcus callidus ATCC 27760]
MQTEITVRSCKPERLFRNKRWVFVKRFFQHMMPQNKLPL